MLAGRPECGHGGWIGKVGLTVPGRKHAAGHGAILRRPGERAEATGQGITSRTKSVRERLRGAHLVRLVVRAGLALNRAASYRRVGLVAGGDLSTSQLRVPEPRFWYAVRRGKGR